MYNNRICIQEPLDSVKLFSVGLVCELRTPRPVGFGRVLRVLVMGRMGVRGRIVGCWWGRVGSWWCWRARWWWIVGVCRRCREWCCDRRWSSQGCRTSGGRRILPMPYISIRMLRLSWHRGRWVLRVAPVSRFCSQLPLCSETLQVAHQSEPQRVLDVQPLTADQVACNFSCTLPEADVVIIHGVPLRVVSERVKTWKEERRVQFLPKQPTKRQLCM